MNLFRLIAPILLVLLIIVVLANSFGIFNKTYGTEIFINNASSDSTFEATLTNLLTGSISDSDRSGCQIAIRAVGHMDDSTKVFVSYYGTPHSACSLPKGKIDTVWSGDFYASKAKVTFLHQHAKWGNLKVSIVFSLPPESWGRQFKNGGWCKI